MVYYNTSAKNSGKTKPFAPYDPEVNALFDDAKKRYQEVLFDAFLTSNYQEFSALKERIEKQCMEESNKVPLRYKALKLLPALLLQYLGDEIFK